MFKVKIKNLIKYFTLFTFLLTLPGFIFPQIPINGFCKYESFNADTSYKGIFSLNFNNDSYSDLVLFGSGNNIITYHGDPKLKFAKPKASSIPIEISAIKSINRKLIGNLFVSISRKNRRIALMEFSAAANARILNEKKLESYPENISVADVNKNGIEEILVSGSSFEGLSLFKLSENKLIEKKIVNKGLFTSANFVDLNNDGYFDIAAVDLLANSLKFYFNIGSSGFKEIRTIKITGKISALQSTDFNLDGYQDLIVTTVNEIQILLGDAYSSYNKIIYVPTSKPANKILTADFNGDGFIDIAYLNVTNSVVSILFAKDHELFFPELTYLKKNYLVDIIPFYSRFVNGILAYSSLGKLYLLDRMKIISDSTQIALGSSIYGINYFDSGNDKIFDLCYFDKDNITLNLLIRNSSGIPAKALIIKLQENFKNLVIDDVDALRKTFYCFTKGKRFIEIFSVDFRSNLVIEDKIYTIGPINDLTIQKNDGEEKASIFVLSNRDGELGLSILTYKDFRYSSSNSTKLAFNVIDAKLVLENPLAIFYWEKGQKSITFSKLIINNDLKPESFAFKFSIPDIDFKNITLLTGDIFNRDKIDAISFITKKSGKVGVLSFGNSTYKINLDKQFSDLHIEDESSVRLGEIRYNGLNKLTAFNDKQEFVTKIDIIYKKRLLLPSKLVSIKNLESFFIKNMNLKKYHLVYIDNSENCITIKELT